MRVVYRVHTAPNFTAECTTADSTNRSLTFEWKQVQSAESYHLAGHLMSVSSSEPSITVNDLTPGSRYTFTVWAEGDAQLVSNNIICADSTSKYL